MPKPAREDRQEYARMMLLEQLESLREEMQELGVSTLVEIEAKLAALHAELDDEDAEEELEER
ncbi:MAG: hypothetical protein ACYC4L_22405 [Chloroflexota bacterium]